MWGPSENATNNVTGQIGAMPDPAAKMTCPRAKEAAPGSTAPEWSAGARVGVDLLSVFLAVAVVVVVGVTGGVVEI